MSGLNLINISKKWKNSDKPALEDINLEVDHDEFVVLLGPSGSGKTTLLRIIAGLESPTEGQILIGGEDVTDREPQERGIGMVFQNYALFPHMTIQKNLSFPLDVAGVRQAERRQTVTRISDLLDLRKHLKKKPHMLSGGERQRAAMGRAMVRDSRVYLFDEPLSNLDELLRSRLRPEIMQLFHQLKVPFIYVTHDQVDAMTMATKIVVMDQGRIQQIGTPAEIYDTPANLFVAGFVGTPKINLLPLEVIRKDGAVVFSWEDLSMELPQWEQVLKDCTGDKVTMGIRPEDLRIGPDLGSIPSLIPIPCTLDHYEHMGSKLNLCLRRGEFSFHLTAPIDVRAKVGQDLTVYLDHAKALLFDTASGGLIRRKGH